MENKKQTSVAITAMICLTVLECWALFLGVDGVLFTLIAAGIAGIGGYLVPSPLKK